MKPVGEELYILGQRDILNLRKAWEESDVKKESDLKMEMYADSWLKLSALIENDRTSYLIPDDSDPRPFKWEVDKNIKIESGCVRMETICVCVAMSEKDDDVKWLNRALMEIRKWFNYPSNIMPMCLREDYLRMRKAKTLLLQVNLDSSPEERMWAAVVERTNDDWGRNGLRRDKEYRKMISESKARIEALWGILEVEKERGRSNDEIAYIARKALIIVKKQKNRSEICLLKIATWGKMGNGKRCEYKVCIDGVKKNKIK